jgi:hypothetical protein
MGVQVQLDHTGADHVEDIERWIHTVKVLMRVVVTSLPIERLPPRLIIECAKSCVFWLNAFPRNLCFHESTRDYHLSNTRLKPRQSF